MPDATITSTASTFGTISGTFAADQSTITGTISGVVDGTLSGSVGVPGPQGDAGPTGPQGPAGEGVPAGGDAGYVLTKVDATDYNTVFAPIDLSSVRALTDYDFTNVADTKLAAFGLTLTPSVGTTIPYDSRLDADYLKLSHDETEGGTVSGNQYIGYYYQSSLNLLQRTYDSTGETYSDIYGVSLDGLAGVKFINWNYTQAAGTMQYGRTGITFGNGSVQTIAFPGFANAALTGNPTAPTPALADNDTSIATTAFVQQELASGTAIAKNLEVKVRNQSGSTITAGSIVYLSGATGNLPLITKAQANNDANSAQTIGFVKTSIDNNGMGYVIVRGVLDSIDTSALTEGVQLYLSPSTAGAWTTTKPYAPSHLVYVGIVTRSHPTLGTIVVAVQNGYELDEIHNVSAQTPSNNDLLAYETSTSLWKNTSFSTLGLLTSATASSTYLAKSDNLASLTSAATARTNLGLGTMATATASDYSTTTVANGLYYPLSANPAGYLTSAPVTSVAGRTGAITLAVADVSGAAPLASPTFSGTPSLPTGTTAVTQAAGNNTTAVATTAFVQQEVPAASTTAAGKVELATDAETATGTDTARGVTPSSWYWSQHATNLWNVNNVTYGGATSGAGASAAASAGGYVVTAPTTAVGNATGSFIVPALQRGINRGSGAFNWSKKLSFSFRISRNNASTDSNTIWRATLGKASAAVGDLAVRGVGAKMAGNGALQLMVHNGTTLTTVTTSSSVVPTQSIVYDIRIMSDGAGNVTMYVDDVLEASTASGPTGTGSSGQSYYVTESENAAIISTTAMSMSVYNLRIDFNP